MNTKICSRCKVEKPVTEYCKYARMKDGLQPACKSCMNESYAKSRNKDKQRYMDVQKSRVNDIRAKVTEWKQQQKCCRCGEDDVSCLDFHHIDPAIKDGTVSEMRNWSWERLQREIEKCIVLCSNCHRKFHAGRYELSSLGVA